MSEDRIIIEYPLSKEDLICSVCLDDLTFSYHSMSEWKSLCMCELLNKDAKEMPPMQDY